MAKNKKVQPNSDVKQDPVAQEVAKDIDLSTKKLEEFILKIDSSTSSDINNTTNQQQRLAHWYDRRFRILNKDPQYPWVGSSNITMPLIDNEVTKAKAPLLSTLNINPIVTFKPLSVRAFDQTDLAEETMQWMLKSRMRDFEKQVEIGTDHMGTYGYTILKTVYEFETETITEKIKRNELSLDDLTQLARALAAVQEGALPQEDFDLAFSQLVSDRWGLDGEDETDQQAIEDIMNFIREEKEEVEIQRIAITRDAPYVSAVDPSLFYPEEGVMELRDAERITEVIFDTHNDMKKKAETGWYDADAVKKILDELNRSDTASDGDGSSKSSSDSGKVFSQLNTERRKREGLTSTSKKGNIENREVYCLYDIHDRGVKDKCLLIYNPDTKIKLRFMEFPYEHGAWPYEQLRNEETDGRFYSPRGVGELIDDIDDMITQNHRNKLNSMTIANAPTFKYRLGSNINPNNMQWTPGQFYPVMNMNDFEAVTVPHNDLSFDNEESNLRFWVESTTGSTDFAFREQRSEARTAKEVGAIENVSAASSSLKVSRFQREMKLVYRQIWNLWMQYGPDRFTTFTPDGAIRHVSKFDMDAKFDMDPTATFGDNNPEGRFIKAQQRLGQIILLAKEGILPLIQDKYEVDIGAAVKDMFDKDDFAASSKIVRKRSDQEIAQIQQQQQQQADQEQNAAQAQDNQPKSVPDLQAANAQLIRESPNGSNQQIA